MQAGESVGTGCGDHSRELKALSKAGKATEPWDGEVKNRLKCTRRGNGVVEEGEKLIKI